MIVAERNFDIVKQSAIERFKYFLRADLDCGQDKDTVWNFPLSVLEEICDLVSIEFSIDNLCTDEIIDEQNLKVDLTMLILLHQLSAIAPHLPADLVDWEPEQFQPMIWELHTYRMVPK